MSTPSFTAVCTLASLLVATHVAGAQADAPQDRRWEIRVASGAFVPIGDFRNTLKNGEVTAVQLSWVIRPSLAITGTFGWARSRDISSIDAPKLDVFTSDIGVEARGRQWFANHAVTFSPFIGLGAGAQSYNYRSLDVDATHNVAGYGAVGGEIGAGRVGLRLELRDYASEFKPLVGVGHAGTRNNVVLMAALRLKRRRPSPNK